MKIYRERNRELWNNWTKIHLNSPFYNLEAFKQGKSSLKSIENEFFREISGKSLLHLQCHFGQDTLSLARLGADVVGVDLSDSAIESARNLATELDLSAEFICSDLYELEDKLDRTFDYVFTSYGVLAWLNDITEWGALVSRYLKKGGQFFIVEFHPMANMLADDGITLEYPYFSHEQPMVFKSSGSYADTDSDLENEEFIWTHNLGDVITSLCKSGLHITEVKEYPFSTWNSYSFLEEVEADVFKAKGTAVDYPLMYSISALKP